MDPTNRVVQVADEAPLPSDETGRLLDLVHRDDFKVIHATPPTEPSGRNDVQGPCEAGDELSNMGSHEDENDDFSDEYVSPSQFICAPAHRAASYRFAHLL